MTAVKVLYRCEVCGAECTHEYRTLHQAPETLPCCADVVPEPDDDDGETVCLYIARRIGVVA